MLEMHRLEHVNLNDSVNWGGGAISLCLTVLEETELVLYIFIQIQDSIFLFRKVNIGISIKLNIF